MGSYERHTEAAKRLREIGADEGAVIAEKLAAEEIQFGLAVCAVCGRQFHEHDWANEEHSWLPSSE